MKIREVSDLHLENHSGWKLPVGPDEKDTILVLAGDICVIRNLDMFQYFFQDVCARFKKILYVFGNHEFYHSQMENAMGQFSAFKSLFSNLEFTSNGKSLEIDGVKFIMATLWTDFDHPPEYADVPKEYSMGFSARCMRDFKIVKDENDKLFTPEKSIELHKKQLKFIVDELKKNKCEKTVVITHHCPSLKSIHAKYWKEPMNPAFSSNLSHIWEEYKPNLLIHGHTHSSFDYLDNEKTRVVCNPHGYGGENFQGFNPLLTIDL